MAWTRQTQAEVDDLFAALRRRDPIGHRLHTLLACGACFLAGFPTTWLEWAGLVAAACCAVRLISHHRILGPLVWEWPARLALLWIAWAAASLAWTAGTRQEWLVEWGVVRYAGLILVLWPVMNERRWLIGALAAGVLVGNLSQVANAIGHAQGIAALSWARFEDRNSGWWDPVVGGSILCAALGLHMAGLALGRSVRERVVGGVLSVATLAGIAATGTRGAWIGAAGVMVFAGMAAGWRAIAARRRAPTAAKPAIGGTPAVGGTRAIGAGVVIVLLVGAVVWFAAGETIAKRTKETREEFWRAVEHDDYSTFTGARLAMWGWAGRAFIAHPVRGVGVGGYQAWARAQIEQDEAGRAGPRPARPLPHAHAHSWGLHAVATTGVVGLGIMVALVVVCVGNGLKRQPSPNPLPLGGGYDAGPALALVGLAAAGMFDTIHVNQQTAYWLWLLVALCMARRPSVVKRASKPREAREFVGVGEGGA